MKLRKFNAKQEEKKIRRKQAYENNVRVRTVVLSMFVLVGSIMLFTYSNFTKTVTVDVMHAKVGKFVVELTYDANGGTVSPSSKDLNKGEVYGTLPTPERNGYTFNGWYTDRTNGTVVGPSTTIGNNDVTIYAHWNANSYDLVVDPNDGEWETHTTAQTYTLEYDKNADIMTISDPTRVGYSFSGWDFTGWTFDSNTTTYTNSTGSTFNTTTKEFKIGYDDVTLEAQWSINQYTLTVDYDNGDEDDEFTLNYGATKTVEDPEKEGYTFTGWKDENNNTNLSYLSGETYTQPAYNVELTATWEVNDYKWIVYHKKQSVDGNAYNIADTEEGEDAYGDTFTGTLQNYTGFANPALQEKTIRVENNYPPTTNVINYNYNRNSYTLTVNANGGTYSGTTPDTVNYEDTRVIANPTKSCYTFNNWTLTGTGSSIQNGIFTMGTANATLTANWTQITYRITFDPNGGSINQGVSSYKDVLCGNQLTLLTSSQVTRAGYTFDGWYTQATGGEEVTNNSTPTESGTIYAHWSQSSENLLNKLQTMVVNSDYGSSNTFGNWSLMKQDVSVIPNEALGINNNSYTNIIYTGINPNNYIWFNDEMWRIIGVYNEDSHGQEGEQLVKIIRNDVLIDSTIPWDSKSYSVGSAKDIIGNDNYDGGSNEWSDSQLMFLLNGEDAMNKGIIYDGTAYIYAKTKVSGDYIQSGYLNRYSSYEYSNIWNKTNGSYLSFDANGNKYENKDIYINFQNTVTLKSTLSYPSQNLIKTVKWKTGVGSFNGTFKSIYRTERTTTTYTNDSNQSPLTSTYRSIMWTGKIGLIYQSDYGYAINGTNRDDCLITAQNYWYSTGSGRNCIDNNWIIYTNSTSSSNGTKRNQWSITPVQDRYSVYGLVSVGRFSDQRANYTNFYVRPTLYLKPSVLIESDEEANGSYDHPYVVIYE